MPALTSTPAFSYDGTLILYGDVIAAAMRWSEWTELEQSLGEPRTPPAELRDAVIAFRRCRGLLSAEDYRRWLEERSLTVADVDAHLLGAPRTIETEAILSGALHAWAERLSRCAAAAHALGRGATGAGLDELLAAETDFRQRVVTEERIAERLSDHRLEWQRAAWQALEMPSEGAAREAVLLVREQGLAFSDVAALAHVTLREHTAYCDEVPDLAGALMSAAPRELIGPLHDGERWLLLQLSERAAPSADDEHLRGRACQELLDDALERHLAGRVRWHVEL